MFVPSVFLIYGVFCFLLAGVWLLWPISTSGSQKQRYHKLTVIIPVRNEAGNIQDLLQDLENQTLGKSQFEVLIANDNSTDGTAEIVSKFLKFRTLSGRLIEVPRIENGNSPKKRAISQCIEIATGEIIISTDGDCRANERWLEEILNYFQNNDCAFLSAPVSFSSGKDQNFIQRIWNQLQEIEFVSLIVSGSCSIKLNQPNMCSGANIAYLKSAFLNVNGFEGNEHIASGDDEFLMHKISKQFPKKIHYLRSKDAIIETNALPDFKSFFNQRKRWAGKWRHYQRIEPKILALFIFSVNLCSIYSLVTGRFDWLVLKMIPEFFFLVTSLFFFKKARLIFLVPFLQIIYPFYVVFFGLVSLMKNSYVWKDRNLR